MSVFILIASVMGGALLSAQSSINGAFSKRAGTYESTFLTFITGAMILAVAVLFFGQGNFMAILEAPKWQLSAVWFGVAYLFLTILAVPKIGVIAANIATVIGQLVTGLLIDHFGWFGGIQIPLDWKRVVAIILMLGALSLIYKANQDPAESKN